MTNIPGTVNDGLWRVHAPTEVICGRGVARKAGELVRRVSDGKILLVTDAWLAKSELLRTIQSSLTYEGLECEVFDGVEANPSVAVLEKGIDCLRRTSCETLLGFGGGSSIDTAKGIAAMARNSGSILDYEGTGKLQNSALPIIAIPTTAGTGSEATASTVFTNTETKFKSVIISPLLFPRLAILDADLTVTLPPEITAATGMDALTHAIESYVSKQANPFSEAVALHAIKLLTGNIEKAFFAGTDIQARQEMLIGSFLAGAAFSQSKLGNVHAISHTFGGVFNIPHGIANAVLLPYVLAFNARACSEKFINIASAIGLDVPAKASFHAAWQLVEYVVELNASLNIPATIAQLGVSLELMDRMVGDAMRSGNVHVNPRLTTHKDIERIIRSAYEGTFGGLDK